MPNPEAPFDTREFVRAWSEIQLRAWQNSAAKGFHDRADDKSTATDGTRLALIHSEVSECLEALRHGNPPDDKIPEFSGAEAELADVVIRVMDFAETHGWKIGEAIIRKMEFNSTRPAMHGGKAF